MPNPDENPTQLMDDLIAMNKLLQEDGDKVAEMPGLGGPRNIKGADGGDSLFQGFRAQDLQLQPGEVRRTSEGTLVQLIPHPTDRSMAIVPGTSLTLGAVERLENASQHAVAVANLYADQVCKTGMAGHMAKIEPRIPEELSLAIAKINGILAGPGPVALDRRPNSVEVVNDPVLHEKALLEAKARETRIDRDSGAAAKQLAQGMVSTETLIGAEVYDERKGAHLDDVADAFEQGKTQGYTAGLAEGTSRAEIRFEQGFRQGMLDERNSNSRLSLWQHLAIWWRNRKQPQNFGGSVGDIEKTKHEHWRNAAAKALDEAK